MTSNFLTAERSVPWRAALLTYALGMVITCLNDRLNHRKFAFSKFCENPEQAGVFGHIHCANHRKEWEDLSLWIYNLVWLILPSPGPELKLVLAHAGLTLIAWFNWALCIGIGAVLLVSLGKAYIWFNTPKQSKKVC